MLKKIFSFLCAFFLCFTASAGAFAETLPEVSAKSAVLIDMENGHVLFAKDENTRRPMASTTKIMTALLTLEAAQISNRVVTITDQMVRVEGSSMGLLPGDQLSLKSLAAGMLTVSGNDAANSAAIAISGSTAAFADRMNQKAEELSLTDTHFVTPSGLDDSEHYTTAHDLAMLAAAAMKNPDFAEIAGHKLMNIPYSSPEQTRRFTNHNKLLSLYQGCTGVKTGFTKKAGRCLVSAAQRDGISLIAVTLNAPDDWNDHEKMLDYGFGSLENVPIDDSGYSFRLPVVGGEEGIVAVAGTSGNNVTVARDDRPNIGRTVELPQFVYAPVEDGQVLGHVRYTLNGKTIASTELVAAASVPRRAQPKGWFRSMLDVIRTLFTIS